MGSLFQSVFLKGSVVLLLQRFWCHGGEPQALRTENTVIRTRQPLTIHLYPPLLLLILVFFNSYLVLSCRQVEERSRQTM